MLRSLLVDFNAYFASVEQQIRPHLRGKPVGVVPLKAETTCCIAASYEAKRFGVRTGTSVAQARKLCPEITFVVAEHEIYVDFHQRAIQAVERIAPVRQVLSIDEMECELTGSWRERDKAMAIARRIKQEILNSLGECMRSSIGIAPNTLLGKLASDMHKPDGLTVLEMAGLPQSIYHLQLSDISGIGRRMLARLNTCGIHSIEDLYAAPRDVLRTAWGGMAGIEMYDKLRGQWQEPWAAGGTTRSLGHSHVLPPAMRNPTGAFDVLNRLAQKAAMRLRKQGFYASAMSVSVHGGHHHRGFSGGSRDTRFGQTQDTAYLLQVLKQLWQAGLSQLPAPKVVNVTLHGLVPAAQHTPSLFEVPDGRPAGPARTSQAPVRDRARLLAAVDQMNRTFGKNTVYFATSQNALDHAPMRIAFNRIPDIETER